MPFSDAVRRAIYDRCGGRCECTRPHEGADVPHSGGRCDNRFTYASGSGVTDWWEAHHVMAEASGGASNEMNGEALCGACYQLVTAAVSSR